MILPPRIKLAALPTPIEEAPRLAQYLHFPRILVKRDDLTGLGLGGNKTRKLEFLLAEALANGARALITTGAVQSNHCRQTAAAAAHFGLDCILVLAGEKPRNTSGNLLLDHLFGAEIIWTTRSQREQALQAAFNLAWEQGRRPYLVPYGGSSPTGAAAYAFAVQELLEQNTGIDWIVFASSSGGTQAGLVVGAALFNYSGRILGISVDEPQHILQARVAELATSTAEHLGRSKHFSSADILVNSDYLGGGYGVLGSNEKEAIRLFAHLEGLLLDPVYTGRAAAGLIGLIRQNYFHPDETILFLHTGGTPALFANQYQEIGLP
jgi:D-cysteine desulfhydrase family pyridoxal phosphate-dependent enzyme